MPMIGDMNTAKLVKTAREEAGISQAELERKAGLAQGHVSRIESGEKKITISTLRRIAEALDSELLIEFVRKTEK